MIRLRLPALGLVLALCLCGYEVWLGDRLQPPALFRAAAAATCTTIRRNLGWAFGYNLAAIPLAAARFLNPVIAAATCVRAVTSELSAVAGVCRVVVEFVPAGESRVTVTCGRPLPVQEVTATPDEAGGYQLAGS